MATFDTLPPWPSEYLAQAKLDPANVVARAADIKVGSVVFIQTDVRVYSRSPITGRRFFQPRTVVAETAVSWIIEEGRHGVRYRKRPTGGTHARLYGLADVDDAVFVHEHMHRILHAVEFLRHGEYGVQAQAEALRKIADLVGYKP